MAALSVFKASSLSDVAWVYDDPYIQRIGHDYRHADVIDHPLAHYYVASVDGVPVGAFLVIHSCFIEADVHALLTKKALQHSRALGLLLLDKVFRDYQISRVTAQVIQGLEKAVNYCKKLGFSYEGMKRNACKRNGQLIGVHFLGVTRQDWENKS